MCGPAPSAAHVRSTIAPVKREAPNPAASRAASVKSATRVLDLLEMLAMASGPMGTSEIARKLEIPKSSAHMLMATLEERSYVVDEGGRRFRLHPILTNSTRSWVGGFRSALLEVGRRAMSQLVRQVEETSFLAVLRDPLHIEYIEKVLSPSEVRCDGELHVPRAVHSNSPGLVLMAWQEQEAIDDYLAQAVLTPHTAKTITSRKLLADELAAVRRRGHASTSDTNTVGVSGVSAPVFGPEGRIVAALNVSVPTPRFSKSVKIITAQVVECAERISAELAQLAGGKSQAPRRLAAA